MAAELKKSIQQALRLSDKAAAMPAINDEIDRNIITARSDMIRVGVSDVIAKSNNPLIEDAIITYCLMKMGDQDKHDKYEEAYLYQIDCLRKHDFETMEG